MMLPSLSIPALVLASVASALTVSVTDIQGPAFQSPLVGQTVNVTGIVSAIGNDGFYILGEPSSDIRASNGLRVFTESSSIVSQLSVGDNVTLQGKVSEFLASTSTEDSDLTDTELDDPKIISINSHNNTLRPVILGKDRSPPTQQFSALDNGPDGFLSVPNNVSQIDTVNATLQPEKFGMDFWESLGGVLVTVPKPTVLDFQNEFGEFWVYGDWKVTGKNSRGGLTQNFGPDGLPDGNPEVIIVAQPLDGTVNQNTSVGQVFEDITGVIQYQFGFFYVLPLTAPKLVSTPSPDIPVATIKPQDNPCTITIGDYNVDNFSPQTSRVPIIASHIATFLQSPDIVFLQEIQDNNGDAIDDGTVDANLTLSTLANAIETINGVKYSFIDINPINDVDGGAGGGNIRQAYLWRPEKLKLASPTILGGSLQNTSVIETNGKLGLSLNPGRIDPNNTAWHDSRKSLAAVWESSRHDSTGERLFTINNHLIAKDGGSSVEGNARPPVNKGEQERTSQFEVVADFVNTILAKDKNANIVVGGDHNEFVEARTIMAAFNGILKDIDEVANVPVFERYTYVFDNENEQLDHIFLSKALQGRYTAVEHIHVNNWGPSIAERASDHDPSVASIDICGRFTP